MLWTKTRTISLKEPCAKTTGQQHEDAPDETRARRMKKRCQKTSGQQHADDVGEDQGQQDEEALHEDDRPAALRCAGRGPGPAA